LRFLKFEKLNSIPFRCAYRVDRTRHSPRFIALQHGAAEFCTEPLRIFFAIIRAHFSYRDFRQIDLSREMVSQNGISSAGC